MAQDVIVLGAGIVGVSVALHLRQRGWHVTLVDRRAPGEATSFGNAGLIEASSVVPYAFPRDWGTVLKFAMNRSTALRYDLRSLPAYAPWLTRFWWESAPARLAAAARDMLPLIQRSVAEHEALIARAGLADLVRPTGWLEAYRSREQFEREASAAERIAREHGLGLKVLDAEALHRLEASLDGGYAGAMHWTDPRSVIDPGALTKGYAALFEREGGRFLSGDAATLEPSGSGWRVMTSSGPVEAQAAVVALGVWSGDLVRRFGYRIPLMAKRGYHMHYAPDGRAALSRPVVDIQNGYVVAPMRRGLRLTTGVELASPDRPPSPVQLERAERIARPVFGLGARIDESPWLGLRPCTPDMRPVIGPADRHRGLWFAFGHAHHGLTLGPVTGRLVGELMNGEACFTDPVPYRAGRF
ncbi:MULTISPECIES: FAD-dependent oxidoreductase [Caballeronia]|uniref:Amino acid dehydrogenase n=1 Tax=Caballeronia zhejiangensis TaxID=871203 RepID=A0A656QW05_9BURK|nr:MULTISPECIES: FAD-dependent oxidoreductase [Caballeronia]EKS70917.1 D-amino-acid dehydrogenase [Burkholderia sp. SJ98]KDR33948.1 amino acid dehydrogenase [Caballeronia zhejiangensis]MCG7403885.1 FAD-binding oxidoreductase [Caballeronia zhejiangensis]MCI1044651.1 FAD-binding oxidoreductase [Caballeronia zhejiangensis]MDR5788823.1 FAD-dependent oxidoreductase [Caballeronia sp. LP003]